jgi:hypothetical protein
VAWATAFATCFRNLRSFTTAAARSAVLAALSFSAWVFVVRAPSEEERRHHELIAAVRGLAR